MILLSPLGPKDDSLDLKPHFGDLGVSVAIRPDFLFTGKWVDGRLITICGERKKPADMCGSMADGSMANKIRLGVEEGNRFQFLVVEGLVRRGRDNGLLEVRRGRDWTPLIPNIDYYRFQSFLLQLHYYMGIHVIQTNGPKSTAEQVIAMYHMFQKQPEDHGSLQIFYKDPLPDLGLFDAPSLTRRWAKELTGIGWNRSKAVEEYVFSPTRIVEMTEKEWQEVPGIGKILAKRIWTEIHEDPPPQRKMFDIPAVHIDYH